MNTSATLHKNLVLLGRMLERLEQSTRPVDADQYRIVVSRISAVLEDTPHDNALDAVLDAFPSVAELYENLNYRHAGLCRSSLDAGLAAELAAREAIGAASRAPAS